MSTARTVSSLVSNFNFLSMRAKEIAESLLTRAVKQGREGEMMERISYHFNRAHDMPEGHAEGIKLARIYDERCGSSQTLRKMSLRTGMLFEDTTLGNAPMPKPTLH